MTLFSSAYLEPIRTCYPDLTIEQVRFHNDTGGQFNVVLFINNALIFRFPRSTEVADTFTTELKILTYLQPHLSLPIPQPTFQNLDPSRGKIFMGYSMLPGQPLWQKILATIENRAILDRLATQLARFLQELHHVEVDKFDLTLPIQDGWAEWKKLYEDFRTHLFPHMRLDAQETVTANFEKYLNDPAQFKYCPTFRHGDFGPSNILYDATKQTISGIIDFDSVGVGDPALDVGAVLNLGEDFFKRMARVYPDMLTLRKRCDFYRSTYALQEALYGLRDNVMTSFEAGIASYR
ncbi:phosphotransferase [Anaerolineales bacterium HSG24]|nr:phosphotransferase [Anaerolineales bacterium HSG24]